MSTKTSREGCRGLDLDAAERGKRLVGVGVSGEAAADSDGGDSGELAGVCAAGAAVFTEAVERVAAGAVQVAPDHPAVWIVADGA